MTRCTLLKTRCPQVGQLRGTLRRFTPLLWILFLLVCGRLPVQAARKAQLTSGHHPPAPSTAAGQSTDDPCMQDKACGKLVNEASRLSRQGQRAEALKQYQAAYKIVPVPWLFVYIGKMQRKLGRCEEAIQSWKQYLSLATQDLQGLIADSKELIQDCEQLLERQKPLRAHPDIPPPPQSPPKRFRTGHWVAAGLSLTALTAGVMTGTLALLDKQTAQGLAATSGAFGMADMHNDRAIRLGYATDTLLTLGAVGLGLTLTLAFAPKRAASSQPKEVTDAP